MAVMELINNLRANAPMSRKEIIEAAIREWKRSPARRRMIAGELYYRYEHDILRRKRTAIGANGELTTVENIPNNQLIDNQYAEAVDKKTNYLVGLPLTFKTEDEEYEQALKTVFDRKFQQKLRSIGEDSLNNGIAWLYVYYDDAGKLAFKRFPGYEVLPFWEDKEHTKLQFAVRLYEVETYAIQTLRVVEKVEIYTLDGVERYILDNGFLSPDVEAGSRGSYFVLEDDAAPPTEYNWDRMPLLAFKYNSKEIPLISKVKCLQDALNLMTSDWVNNLEENYRNTVLIIRNYDGTELGEFRQNLNSYGAIKVSTIDNLVGDVEALRIEVNSENWQIVLQELKKAIRENAKSYDAKDDRMFGSSPNEMNIQSMYSDIDLDANMMETEYQAAFEELLYFVDDYLANSGKGDFSDRDLDIIFNRDIMINESSIIDDCVKSQGLVSRKTILSNHPYVTNVALELEQLKKERQEELDDAGYANKVFSKGGGNGDEDTGSS